MLLPPTNILSHSRRQWLGLLLITSLFCAIAVYTFHVSRLEVDEGLFLSSAARVAQGQVMYRDFFEFWMPGTVYATALFLKLFGQTYAVARLEFILVNFLTCAVLYLSLRRSGFAYIPALASIVAFFFNSYSTLAVNHHWFGVLGLTVCFWLSLAYYQQKPKAWLAFSWGIAIGLTILFTQFEGAIAVASAPICLWLFAPANQYRRHLTILAAGVLIAIAPVIIAVSLLGIFNQFIYGALIFPFAQYHQVNGEGLNPIIACQTIIVIGITWLLYHYRLLTPPLKAMITVALIAIVACLSSGSRLIPIFIGLFTNCLLIYFGWAAAQYWLRRHRGRTLTLVWAKANQIMAQPTVHFIRFAPLFAGLVFFIACFTYYLAFDALVLGDNWLNILVLTHHPIITPAGPVITYADRAARLSRLTRFIEQHTSSSQPIYFGPYSSYYNFLLHRPNPTRYSQLTPGYNPPWMFRQAIKELNQVRPAYIVLVPDESPFAFPSNNPLSTYLKHHYRQITTLPSVSVNQGTEQLKAHDPPPAIWQPADTSTL